MNTLLAIIILSASLFGTSNNESANLGITTDLTLSADSLRIGSITIKAKQKHLIGGTFFQGAKKGTIIGSAVTRETPDSIHLFITIAGAQEESYAALCIPRVIVSEEKNVPIDRPLFELKSDRIRLIGGVYAKALIITAIGCTVIWAILFHFDETEQVAKHVHL